MVPADLEPRHPVDRKAVVPALGHLQVEHREPVRLEQIGPARLEPAQYLAFRLNQPVERFRHLADPCARRDDEPAGRVRRLRSLHRDAAPVGGPVQHRFASADLGAFRLRRLHVGDDAALGQEIAAVRLKDGHDVLRQPVAGEPPVHLVAGKDLVRQAVLLAGCLRALEDPVVRGTGVQRPRDMQQALARPFLDFAPQRIRAPKHRHIGRVFRIGQADDARLPVGRAQVVRDVELFQPQHPASAAGELPGGGAAHAAHADHDDVV